MLELQIDKKKNKIFAPPKNDWLTNQPEERIRQAFICKLVNEYGYLLDQMVQEMKVTNPDRSDGSVWVQMNKEWEATSNYRKDLYEFLKTLPEEFLKERLDMIKKMREVKLWAK